MAISQEQADTADVFHQNAPVDGRVCSSLQGPRRWRRSGKTQRWKRNPERFRVPIKFGLYVSDEINEQNADRFHTGADCPVAPEGHN